ncbi:MAG: hypothetical protein GF331_02450, partial [Chitinivibrionales bacterium]|nr:hypothetical protein [Chitinivibrionales bacterium]
MIMYATYNEDSTAEMGAVNCNTLVPLMEHRYYVESGTMVMIAPQVDTSQQNALQIMMATEMDGMVAAEEVYLMDGCLYFVETSDTYVFSKTKPTVSGGQINGTVSVTGNFGQGALMVVSVDPTSESISATFLDTPGEYCLVGLSSGDYIVA